MTKHLQYLRYLLRHKWFVMIECWRHGLYWRGLVHDWSKFLPSEWFPYVEYFYTDRRSTEWFDLYSEYGVAELAPWGASVDDHFNLAWLKHIHRNRHHWQYWILREDDGGEKCIPMPERCRIEMLCDWRGAGRAQGTPDTLAWYTASKDKMRLHASTRAAVESELRPSTRTEVPA